MSELKKEYILNSLQDIFRIVFDDNELMINYNTSSKDIEDWDSLEHINLLTKIEEVFKIKFSINEVSDLLVVGDMVNLIKRKVE